MRYNAQKKKVGNYYSTPIFSFRCKCHLCSGWFEIRTDPQNAQYVVFEGARRQEDTWDPAENGGYAVFETEAPKASEGGDGDAFAALEKDTDQRTAVRIQKDRLSELEQVSARMSADPYAVSRSLRDKFRVEKRESLAKQRRDEGILEKYGLYADIELGNEETEVEDKASERWVAARENRGLSSTATSQPDLTSTIRRNTAARKFDVFDMDAEPISRVRLKRKNDDKPPEPPEAAPVLYSKTPTPTQTLLAGYASDSDSD